MSHYADQQRIYEIRMNKLRYANTERIQSQINSTIFLLVLSHSGQLCPFWRPTASGHQLKPSWLFSILTLPPPAGI